jgi:TolA-binding protein
MMGLRGGKMDECRGDLIARERRGELSGNDCLALRAHLAECDSCRMARQVFVDLDDVSGVDLRDGLRIEKMSLAARRWGERASRPRVRSRAWAARRPLRTLAFAAVVLLIGGTASATMWWFRHPQPVAPRLEKIEKTGNVERAPRAKVGRAAKLEAVEPTRAPVAGPPTAAEPPPIVRDRPQPSRRLALRSSARAGGESIISPSALLRQASQARRAGDAERAVTLYRKLQQDFPRSSEATLSAVSLGGLLLDRRLPRAALTQFDRYLVASSGGVLIPEALYGRGRALAALGDRQEERRTWDRLLTDFPESAYGPFAKRRLQELK